MTVTLPNMLLILPDVGVTTGTTWASMLNTAYGLIDSHDHSTNKGVRITPAGLNISSDLTFGQNNATNLRSARLYNNTTFTPGVNDLTCVYALNNELYYRDGSGNAVQITTGGSVNAGTIASLTIKDSAFTLQYFADTSRQARFDLSLLSAASTSTYSLPPASSVLVSRISTDTLTNKTITTAGFTEVSTPATPSAGTAMVYPKSDHKLYIKDSTGIEQRVTAGTPIINYMGDNYNFENGTVTGWVAYKNAAGATPVNGTGGAPTTTVAITSSSPLRGTYSLQCAFPASNVQGEGISYDFTISAADISRTMNLTFDSNTTSISTGDVRIYVYDITNSVLITPSSVNLTAGLQSQLTVTWLSTTSLSYRVIFHRAVTTAAASNFLLDHLVITTATAVSLPAATSSSAGTITRETAWTAYTPTLSASWGTTSNNSAFYKILGDSMFVRGSFTNGTLTASQGSIAIPGGFTINSAKLSLSNTVSNPGNMLGNFGTKIAGTSVNAWIVSATGTSTSAVYVGFRLQGSQDFLTPDNSISSNYFPSGILSYFFEVPIV